MENARYTIYTFTEEDLELFCCDFDCTKETLYLAFEKGMPELKKYGTKEFETNSESDSIEAIDMYIIKEKVDIASIYDKDNSKWFVKFSNKY